jgi:hypothetical protein
MNIKTELAKQNGAVLTLPVLKDMLFGLRVANLADFAPEIGVNNLLEIVLNNGWVFEDSNGMFHVRISND